MKKIIPAVLLIVATLSIAGCSAQEKSTMLLRGRYSVQPKYVQTIDSLVNDAISRQAMPGCRILAVKDQYVIFDKSYGYLTYDSIQPVNDSTMYDIASVTKMAASALLMMKLYEDRKIDLDTKFCEYFPGFYDNGATLRDALAHQAGFRPGIDLKRLEPELRAACVSDSTYNASVARRKIWQDVEQTPLNKVGEYLYSDLGFYFYPELATRFYGLAFVNFLNEWFYYPLGVKMLFNPLNKYPADNIAPTENDTIWRKKVVRGTVHDETAEMMGGVSGHAGLFATANDLAVLMQMLLSNGEYGGIHFFKPETVRLFTSQQFENNRRGLVFDKPVIDTTLNGTPSKMASHDSFGHTGFTGPFVWADPQNKLILVFLCNSVYPNRSFTITKLDLRTKIHDVFYSKDLIRRRK
ncbi:MAG: serine hydrolase [Bacteroidales bacterium]|nr:serine hydrolase [Bacteroidales bacterium]